MRSLLILALVTVAAGVTALTPDPTAVSAVVILVFIAVVPGAAMCRLLGLAWRGALGWTTVIGTGFAAAVLVSTGLLSAQAWSPARTVLSLCILSGVLLLAALVFTEGRRRADEDPTAHRHVSS